MDIDTAPPPTAPTAGAHRDAVPPMQLDLPPPDEVMMEVDPADFTLLATSPLPARADPAANPSSPTPPFATPPPTTPDHAPSAATAPAPHRTAHPTPPVALVSSSDVTPWPKLKLDQLFVEWLARPDAQRWLATVLDDARRDPSPPATPRATSGSSSPKAAPSVSPAPPGSPVSRLFRAHLPFTDVDSPPAPPSPVHPRALTTPHAAEIDLGKSGSASPLRDASPAPESPVRKCQAQTDSSPPDPPSTGPDQITLEHVADGIAGMNAHADAPRTPPGATPESAAGALAAAAAAKTAPAAPTATATSTATTTTTTTTTTSTSNAAAAAAASAPSSAPAAAASPTVADAETSTAVAPFAASTEESSPGKDASQIDKSMPDANPTPGAPASAPALTPNGGAPDATVVSAAHPPRIPRPPSQRPKRKTLPRFYFPCGKDAEKRESKERLSLGKVFHAQREKQQPGVGRAEFAELVVDTVGLPSYFASIVYNIVVEEFPRTSAQDPSAVAAAAATQRSPSAPPAQPNQPQQQQPQPQPQQDTQSAQESHTQSQAQQVQPAQQQPQTDQSPRPSGEETMSDVGENSAQAAATPETAASRQANADGQSSGGQDDTGGTNSDTTMGDAADASGQDQRANGFHTAANVATSGEVMQDPTSVGDAANGMGGDASKDFITEDQMKRFYEARCAGKSKEERLFLVMRERGASRSYLIPSDFKPLLRALLMCHQGLAFLHATPEFQQRYSETVIERIYFGCTRQHNGRLTLHDMKRSKLLETLMVVDEEEDINRERRFFSYEHFYVLYCRFWELDANHDLQIDREDLMRYSSHSLTNKIVDRIFGGFARPLDQPDNSGYMSYTDFIWFCLSEEDKTSDTAIDYWFRCIDRDGDGLITMYDMEFFYKEQLQRMESFGHEPVQVKDILCQLLDMIKPKIQPPVIRRRDLKRSRLAGNFFNVLFNLNKFFAIEARDPLHIRQEHATPELTDWDRFAALEYLRLSAEEEGEEDEAWEDVGEAANPLMAGEAPF